MLDFAQRYNLTVNIGTQPGWHFPGRVLFITLWKKEAYDAYLKSK
jgi:hypothetical protein